MKDHRIYRSFDNLLDLADVASSVYINLTGLLGKWRENCFAYLITKDVNSSFLSPKKKKLKNIIATSHGQIFFLYFLKILGNFKGEKFCKEDRGSPGICA